MRVRSVPFTVAATLAAGLALTACGAGGAASSAAPGTPAPPVGTVTAVPAPGAPAATGPANGASPAAQPASASAAAPKATGAAAATGTPAATAAGARCTAADLELTVRGPDLLADDKQPAYAYLHAVNTSSRTCTLTGFPGIQVSDDDGRTTTPLTAARATDQPVRTVVLKPKQLANANLAYQNINLQGSPSGRRVCGVTSSKVQAILPDETQALQIKVTGGVDNNTLNICGALTVQPFEGVPGVNA